MTLTHRTLDFDNIGTAWHFVEELEEDPARAWGTDRLSSEAMRDRDGVYRIVGSPVDDYTLLATRFSRDDEATLDARDDEDEDFLLPIDRDPTQDREEAPCPAEPEEPAACSERFSARVPTSRRRVRRASHRNAVA